jgi:glycosyltransferase involved in cell wall biosynthesis
VNILQVTPGYWPVIGGVERHVEALVDRLIARGHEVTVATLEPRGAPRGGEQHRRAEIIRFPAFGAGDAYRVPLGLSRYLRNLRNRFDIVHVHNYHAPLIPLVAYGAAQPFVVTTHMNDAPHSRVAQLLHVAYRAVGAAAVRQAAAVVCVTEAERLRVVERLGVPHERTQVIPNGFEPALLKGRDSDNAGERNPRLLLSVGRLQPYKRVDAIIRALAWLDSGYQLMVIGDGPRRNELQALADELRVAGRVSFVGRAADGELVDWYRRTGVVVSLSSAEAFGMTVLEGVAAGAQVVTSDIPVFRDLAAQFPQQVITVDAEAPEQVAQAVRQAAQRVGNGAADVRAFTWDAVADQLLEVYRSVLEQARSARSIERVRKREDRREARDARTGAEQGGQ